MRFDLVKLDLLKMLTTSLYAGQKRANALAQETADMPCCPAWQKKNATLCRENMGNEKTAIKIAALVHELGFGDLDPNRTYHDGWSERK